MFDFHYLNAKDQYYLLSPYTVQHFLSPIDFPWYKYNTKKRSWKSSIFNFCLFALIAYLAYGAVMERNRRWKKRVDDYIFDSQISYHTHRIMRIISLPLFKFVDLSKYHDSDCIINNPFKTKGIPKA